MDDQEVWNIRVRHAVRAGIGGAIIAAVGLTTTATSGCIPSLLFFIMTIAGTPENYEGFQLRCASLTFLGAILGTFAYVLVAVIGGTSTVGNFFACVPFIAFFSTLRADASLSPMPAVANVLLGLYTISRFGKPRSDIPNQIAASLIDSSIAWAVAVAVNVFLKPDRAGSLGRRIVAKELRDLGTHISRIAGKTFGSPYENASCGPAPGSLAHFEKLSRGDGEDTNSRHRLSIFVEEGLQRNATQAGLHSEDYVFLTRNVSRRFANTSVGLERTEEMIRSAEQTLCYLHRLSPFGRTRVEDYGNLARAKQLFAMSAFEPSMLPEKPSRWRNAKAWAEVVETLQGLVTKVSSLESVSCRHAGPARFSQKSLVDLFGEAYIPFWITHFASCAAACAVMSTAMCHATCAMMFSLSGEDSDGSQSSCTLAPSIDPRKWRRRRAEMYYGFLVRYRLRMRSSPSVKRQASGTDLRIFDGRDVKGVDQHYKIRSQEERTSGSTKSQSSPRFELKGARIVKNKATVTSLCDSCNHTSKNGKGGADQRKLAELQAMSFFGTAAHALSEEIGHVQESMVKLANSADAKGILAPFWFVVSAFPGLFRRIKTIGKRNLHEWEVRFAVTHTLLLLLIVGLSLFLPTSFLEKFEANEIAWIFTSAALAAQLSAEPTLFIGTCRVVATAIGASLALGFNFILKAAGREEHPTIQYLIIPYIFIMTVIFMLAVPAGLRYAGFLVVVTNAIILFCPRNIPECTKILATQSIECFATWQYVVARSVNVSIGVVFALLFHFLFWPRLANQEALRSLALAFINAARLLGKLRRTYFSYGMDKISLMDLTVEHDEMVKESADLLQESLEEGDLYRKECFVLREIKEKVTDKVSGAVLLVKSEAGVWRSGPLRLRPLLPQLLPDFVALSVSLSEMASLLGRRPIFSTTYRRSVYEHYIRPVLAHYETIQVSLNNIVGITDRVIEDEKEMFLKENALDLHQAIVHLARTRNDLREDAENRAKEFESRNDLELCLNERLSVKEGSLAASLLHNTTSTDLYGYQDDSIRTAIRSIDDLSHSLTSASRENLSVDDVVLYNAFSFIADGCLSAFVRIAVVVLTDTEEKLAALKKKKDKK